MPKMEHQRRVHRGTIQKDYDNPARLRGCGGKRAFTSKKRVLQAINSKKKRDGVILTYYHCQYCSNYHVTSQMRGNQNGKV